MEITNKTSRANLILEIEFLRVEAWKATHLHNKRVEELQAEHSKEIAAQRETINELRASLREANETAGHLAHKAEVAETDVHNLLGALRVMADSSRSVRIRARSVQSADMATALPYRNTDKI
jgi:hypothetical protein